MYTHAKELISADSNIERKVTISFLRILMHLSFFTIDPGPEKTLVMQIEISHS